MRLFTLIYCFVVLLGSSLLAGAIFALDKQNPTVIVAKSGSAIPTLEEALRNYLAKKYPQAIPGRPVRTIKIIAPVELTPYEEFIQRE